MTERSITQIFAHASEEREIKYWIRDRESAMSAVQMHPGEAGRPGQLEAPRTKTTRTKKTTKKSDQFAEITAEKIMRQKRRIYLSVDDFIFFLDILEYASRKGWPVSIWQFAEEFPQGYKPFVTIRFYRLKEVGLLRIRRIGPRRGRMAELTASGRWLANRLFCNQQK